MRTAMKHARPRPGERIADALEQLVELWRHELGMPPWRVASAPPEDPLTVKDYYEETTGYEWDDDDEGGREELGRLVGDAGGPGGTAGADRGTRPHRRRNRPARSAAGAAR